MIHQRDKNMSVVIRVPIVIRINDPLTVDTGKLLLDGKPRTYMDAQVFIRLHISLQAGRHHSDLMRQKHTVSSCLNIIARAPGGLAVRQMDILQKSDEHLAAAERTIEEGMSADFVVIDLRSAWEKLGEITGETVGEDIIDQIFSQFCIGK